MILDHKTITSLCKLHGKIGIQINITVYTSKEKMKVYTAMVKKTIEYWTIVLYSYTFIVVVPQLDSHYLCYWMCLSCLFKLNKFYLSTLVKQYNNPHTFDISFCSNQVKYIA